MSEPYSLEEVVRVELLKLRPGHSEGLELRSVEADEAESATLKEKAETLIRDVRDGFHMREVDEEAALQALPPTLTRALFREKLTALCFSGGGIRSASFCLGVLQALAQRKLLTDFDYLSTVSGGGYIGGWLTAWASRKGWSMTRVQDALAERLSNKEVENLRAYSNYLTPRAGLMSADTWVGVATVARNLVLNWSLFLPVLLITIATPKFIAAIYEFLATYPALQPGGQSYDRAAWAMLVSAALLYGVAALFISREILKTQQQKKAEDVAAASPGSPTRKPAGDEQSYGAGNIESALIIVFFVAAAACVSTSVLAAMPLTLGWFHFFVFGLSGATTWYVAFIIATLLERRAAGGDAVAEPQTDKVQESNANIGWLALARLAGGLFFGVTLLIGFAPLGDHVRQVGDDRYPIVLGVLIFVFAHLAGGTVFSAFSSRLNRMDDALEWSARGAGWLFAAGIAWLLYATAGLIDYDFVRDESTYWVEKLVIALGGISGVGAALFGLSGKTAGPGARPAQSLWSKLAVLGAVFFFVVLLLLCSRLYDRVVFGESFATRILERRVGTDDIGRFLVAYAVLAAWTLLASFAVNVNKFSLHGFYRNRLIRAFLGASNLRRRPNAFTGFDPGDNLDMAQLHDGKPMLIVNTALNLVRGDNLAWQERKASSFSISRLTTGNPAVGYRPSDKYGGVISLGTAVAVSGAAVSPNMGYHSSPILTFAMTLFNARLGWWLGNPRREAWRLAGPRHAFASFLMELFGYTTDANRFIYLSDGGHFENLGVYEMLLRRCRTIVAVDVGADGDFKFEDLGNMVRKARIDLGVEIRFAEPAPVGGATPTRLGLVNRPDFPRASSYCIIGDICYPGIEEKGALIYIKAAIHGDEPEDVWSYAAAHADFPHETTGDQFFSESQFESYRRLGLFVGSNVFGGDGEKRSHALALEALARASTARG